MTDGVILRPAVLDALMPMHLTVDAELCVTGLGRTLRKLTGDCVGRHLSNVATLRPSEGADLRGLDQPTPVRLRLIASPADTLVGMAAPLPGGGAVMNLSAGIATIETVRRHNLTADDFAPTDLAVEMLYLFEAKEAVLDAFRDLNARTESARRMAEEQAVTDTLTGLRNRRALDALLARLVRGRAPFALAHLDLDWFKAVNDTHGHAAGDHVLQTVARILEDETRAMDTVARIGGDEFVLVFPDLCDRRELTRIAGRILHRLEVPIAYGGAACRVSASIGIACSQDYDMPEGEVMLSDADKALYLSKEAGRGRVSFAA